MRFFLVKNAHLELGGGLGDKKGLIHREGNLTADIISTGDSNHLNQTDCDKLKNFLESTDIYHACESKTLPEKPANGQQDEVTPVNWEIKVTLTLMNKDSEWKDGVVCITNPVPAVLFGRLDRFAKAYDRELKINANFRDLKFCSNSTEYKTSALKATDMTLVASECGADLVFKNTGISYAGSKAMQYWGTSSYIFECDLDIEVVLTQYTNLNVFPFVEKGITANKSILSNEINCDLTIISSDSKPVKCHKVFLLVHSQEFATLFNEVFEDSKPGTIQMPDMTEKSVRALLKYLYLNEVDTAKESSIVAFELYQAGYRYKISSLEQQMIRLLLDKPTEWFCLDIALRLYIFMRNVEGYDELKRRAVELIKLNFGQLSTTDNFRQTFENNATNAIELCSRLASL